MLLEQIADQGLSEPTEAVSQLADGQSAAAVEQTLCEILAEMAADEGSTFHPTASLYQDFSVRCRMRHISGKQLDLNAFRRRFAMAAAGVADPADERWASILRTARSVPDDVLAPYLLIAKAALQGEACPDDQSLARVYGTSSPGRIRRLMEHLEKSGLIVLRTDFGGRRSIGIPELGLTTAPLEA